MIEIPKVIVCDLEGTLGEFRQIIGSKPNETISIYLRPKLKEGLSSLSEKYKLVIATTQVEPFADTALKAAQVRNFFSGIYDYFDFKTKYEVEKSFKPIARDFGIPEESVSENILFMGDSVSDYPEKGSDIVFINVDEIIRSTEAPRTSMASLADLIKALDIERGFNSGFHVLKREYDYSSYTFYEKDVYFEGGKEKGIYTPQISKTLFNLNGSHAEKKEFTITAEEIELIKSELDRAKQHT
jgi:hypothetical protein